MWLSANDKPRISDDSDGFWRRLHLIPFKQKFAERADLTLKDRLRAEAPGILAWLVQGAIAWQRDGLCPPPVVTDAVAEYRQENETLTPFYDARCEVGPALTVGTRELFDAYVSWCNKADVPGYARLRPRDFGAQVEKRFPKLPHARYATYSGIGLRAVHQDEGPGDAESPRATSLDF